MKSVLQIYCKLKCFPSFRYATSPSLLLLKQQVPLPFPAWLLSLLVMKSVKLLSRNVFFLLLPMTPGKAFAGLDSTSQITFQVPDENFQVLYLFIFISNSK